MKTYSFTASQVDLAEKIEVTRENLEVNPLSQQLLTAILRESADYAENTRHETAHQTAIGMVERICQTALERNPAKVEFIDELADTLKDALFGSNVPPQTKEIINNMRNTAHDRQRQQEEEAHQRQLERQKASAPILQPVQNMYTPYSITNDGQANIGGGTIAIGG